MSRPFQLIARARMKGRSMKLPLRRRFRLAALVAVAVIAAAAVAAQAAASVPNRIHVSGTYNVGDWGQGSCTTNDPATPFIPHCAQAVANAAPAAALLHLVKAAEVSDAAAMWRLLDRRTQERLGPLSRFRREVAGVLTREFAAIGSYRVALSEQITWLFAVAAIAGKEQAYATSLRLEQNQWKIILRSPVRLRAICPDPGATVARRTQVAAEIKMSSPILEAGMWFDGLAFPTKGDGPSNDYFTMWNEAPQPLARGFHVVVAFASTRAEAAALAWTFLVR